MVHTHAPDLTKAWLDPMWDSYMLRMGKASKEEAIAEFLQHPSDNPSNERNDVQILVSLQMKQKV